METLKTKILRLAKEYINAPDYKQSFITREWILKISNELKLKDLNDLELANMWDFVDLVLEQKENYYMINLNGCTSEIEWRKRDNTPLAAMTIEETISYYENKRKEYLDMSMLYMDVKSAFTETINQEARRRKRNGN